MKCTFCFFVVHNAVQCKNKKCNRLYCKECVQKSIANSNRSCPFKCDGNNRFEYEEIGLIMRNIINGVKLKCLKKEMGCDAEISLENFTKHHTETCELLYTCECNKKCKNRQEMVNHLNTCLIFNKECPFCKKAVSINQLETHVLECNRICELCAKVFTKSELIEHESVCEEKMIECKYCRDRYKRKEEILHTEDICFANTNKYNHFKEDNF